MADTSTCAVCRTPIHRTRVGWEHDIVAMGEWAVTAHHAACPSEPEVTTEHEALETARQELRHWLFTGPVSLDDADRHVSRFEAAFRTQADEDVRRLVEAARAAVDADRVMLVATGHLGGGYKRHMQPVIDDIVAALEPFKAVAPTADAKEADRG